MSLLMTSRLKLTLYISHDPPVHCRAASGKVAVVLNDVLNDLADNYDGIRWSNFGYWRYLNFGQTKKKKLSPAQVYNLAGTALAQKLADFAHLSSKDHVLDLGCGFGDQDDFWLKKYKPRSIQAININKNQIRLANLRYANKNQTLSFSVVSAEELLRKLVKKKAASSKKLNSTESQNKFTIILSLDAAYHFDRLAFLENSLMILPERGRVAWNDIIFNDKIPKWKLMLCGMFCLAVGIPLTNLKSIESLKRNLIKKNLVNANSWSKHFRAEDITEDVWVGFIRHYKKNRMHFYRNHPKSYVWPISFTAWGLQYVLRHNLAKYYVFHLQKSN